MYVYVSMNSTIIIIIIVIFNASYNIIISAIKRHIIHHIQKNYKIKHSLS